MKTINNRTLKSLRQGRCAFLRVIWPVILAVTLFALPAESYVITIDPGAFPDFTDLTDAYTDVTLIAEVPDIPGSFVSNISDEFDPTEFILAHPDGGSSSTWTDHPTFVKIFRAEFSIETAFVSVDMRDGNIVSLPHLVPSTGVLEAYDAGGLLLETVSATLESKKEYQTLSITRATPDIAFIRAYGTGPDQENCANISLLTYDLTTVSGWVWMDGSSDFGYSLNEGNLVYFFAPWPVLYYNSTTGFWDTDGPVDWVYVDWPFLYDFTDTLWFALPPVEGAWVYHYSTHHWEFLPRTLP